jgi:hypothetical protein
MEEENKSLSDNDKQNNSEVTGGAEYVESARRYPDCACLGNSMLVKESRSNKN